MTARLFLAMFLFLALTGCLRTHTVAESPDQIAASVEINKDDFSGATTVRTKTKGIDLDMSSTLTYFYRYDSRIPDQVQLYVGANLSCWPSLNRAIGQDQTQMSVVKISAEVQTIVNTNICVEEIGINVPLPYLEKMTAQDWTFRLYGASTSSWDLTIDRKSSQGFLQAISNLATVPTQRSTDRSTQPIPKLSDNAQAKNETKGKFTAANSLWYKVKAGDNLQLIASEYTRDRNNWREIANFNQIENSASLSPGQIVYIPKHLFIHPSVPRAPKQATPIERTTASSELSPQRPEPATVSNSKVTSVGGTCSSLGSMAGTIMESRQAGIPLSQMLATISTETSLESQDIIKKIVIAAYETPRYNTQKIQKQEITEFENKILLACLKTN